MAASQVKKDYAHCHGCGLCTLICPAWHQSRDVCGSPHGHAKALKAGGEINVVGLFDCILCGACEPICPENIGIMQMLIDLRREVVGGSSPVSDDKVRSASVPAPREILLLADDALLGDGQLLGQTLGLLNSAGSARVALAQDNGSDIVHALQSGHELSSARLDDFLASIKAAKALIVSDGLLKKALQAWLPAMKIDALGYVLSSLPALAERLRAGDLYLIESRAYNADVEGMVRHYDRLRRSSGCRLNLDLQRLAMPSGGMGAEFKKTATGKGFEANKQGLWLLQGLDIERIIVEHVDDGVAMAKVSDVPVIHVAELLTNA